MKEFKKVDKIFIRSNNSTTKIFNRYLGCLIAFFLLTFAYNLLSGNSVIAFNLLKSTLLSLLISMVVGIIFNCIKKDRSFFELLFKDNILSIAIILGLCSFGASYVMIIIASIISIIVRKSFKNITLSASLYGILIILLSLMITNRMDTPLTNLGDLLYVGTYDSVVLFYGKIYSYLFGVGYYLSPIFALIIFIYLFYKKSIKYNIVVTYILTFSVIMLLFGMFNDMNIWYLFFQLCTGNILFLTVFCLVDYPNTPITTEGQVIYGISLGIISSILRFIVPELAIVLTLILGPLILTRVIDNISVKLK